LSFSSAARREWKRSILFFYVFYLPTIVVSKVDIYVGKAILTSSFYVSSLPIATWGWCYDFKNIFAEKVGKIVEFDSKYLYFMSESDHNTDLCSQLCTYVHGDRYCYNMFRSIEI
jgi:hypothetical protein